jgi:hypothetical protein
MRAGGVITVGDVEGDSSIDEEGNYLDCVPDRLKFEGSSG